MIVRIWRGVTPTKKAEQYLEYLMETGVKDYRAIPGNQAFRFCTAHMLQIIREEWGGRVKSLLFSLGYRSK